jgi:hypothetical protein
MQYISGDKMRITKENWHKFFVISSFFPSIGCLVFVGLLYVNFWGVSISDFHPVTDGKITGTVYEFSIGEKKSFSQDVYLVHSSSKARIKVAEIIFNVEYVILEHKHKSYLILRSFGGGTNGATYYSIWDITETPYEYASAASCNDPKLRGDTLWFNFDGRCAQFLDIDYYNAYLELK